MNELFRSKLSLIIYGLIIFFLTLALSFLGASSVIEKSEFYIPSVEIGIWNIIFVFALATAVIFFLLKLSKNSIIFKLFFSLTIFLGVWFLLDIFFGGKIALVAGFAIIVLRYLLPIVAVQNILIILGVSGVAINLGLAISWQSALALVVILSVYDIFAVYGTEYMVYMMKGMISRGVVFAAVIPDKILGFLKKLDLSEDVKTKDKFIFLGSGDLALPAIFIVSLLPVDKFASIISLVGALFGFILGSFLFSFLSKDKPMPGLPPIVFLMVISFLIYYLIIH